MANCPLDIVIGCDKSGSIGQGTNPNWPGVNDFVRELVTGLDHLMDGSINGIPGSSDIQVGTYVWTQPGSTGSYAAQVVRNMTDDSSLIESDTNSPLMDQILGVPIGGGDDYDQAVTMGMTMLNNFGTLGNRSSQPNYRRIMVIVTDATSTYACTGFPGTTFGLQTNMSTDVWNVGSLAGSPELDVEVYAYTVHQPGMPPPAYPANVECLVPVSAQATNIDHGTGAVLGALGQALANTLCGPADRPPITYNCSDANGVSIPGGFINPWDCYDPGTGNGQYQGLTAYSDCLANCNDSHVSPGETGYSWNCIVDKFGNNQCNSVLGSVGQYITEQDCLTNCRDVVVDPSELPTDPTMGELPTDPTMGWNCDSSTGQCSGPVIGGSYPSFAACLATCSVVGVGNCVPIDSCPCGWGHVFNVSRNRIDCTNRLTTMPSIKKCMSFQLSGVITQPAIGDTWINSGSHAGISWTEAVVVNIANPTIVGTGTPEVKTTPCRGL